MTSGLLTRLLRRDGRQGEEREHLSVGHKSRSLHVVPGPDLAGDGERLLGGDGGAAEPTQVGHRALVSPQVGHAATQQERGQGVPHHAGSKQSPCK